MESNPCPHLVQVVLSMAALFCYTDQVKRDHTRLRVDIDAVVGYEVLKEVGVDLEVYI